MKRRTVVYLACIDGRELACRHPSVCVHLCELRGFIVRAANDMHKIFSKCERETYLIIS